MPEERKEFFSSRWGLILSVLGIAVGTGNIWRFSRIVAQNGGGSFLIPWAIFLIFWSIPLIIAEFGIGKFSRKGPWGAIPTFAGKKFTWMGGFVAFVSMGIMFYYSVVAGWCIRYFIETISTDFLATKDFLNYWNNFSQGYSPVLFHFIAMLIGSIVVYKGIVNGIEKTNKFLVSSLLVIILILLIRAVTLPDASKGLEYLFTPNFDELLNLKVWMNALTQNAWDTGAGWGLIMVYAIYMKKKEEITTNAAIIGFGNNSVSLIAGIIIFSTVFSLSSSDAIQQITTSGPANTGLTFIFLPVLFSKLSSFSIINTFFAAIFFLALSFAAISSLISMIELSTRTISDFGIKRNTAVKLVGVLGFLFGLPSALNINVFLNQDWVWGVGLILSGGFISFAIIKFGVDDFRTKILNFDGCETQIGGWYNVMIKYIIPLEAIVMLSWWLISSLSWNSEWWNPFAVDNLGTCIFQWGIVIILLLLTNRIVSEKLLGEK